MKKHLLFIAVLIFVAAACKIDKAGLPQIQTNALLINKWYVKSLTTISPAMGGHPQSSYTATDFTPKDYYKFNTDNTAVYSMSSPDTVETTKYSYFSSASVQEVVFADPHGGSPSIYIIQKLTADSLIFSTTISATVYSSIDSTTTIYPVIYRLARN